MDKSVDSDVDPNLRISKETERKTGDFLSDEGETTTGPVLVNGKRGGRKKENIETE